MLAGAVLALVAVSCGEPLEVQVARCSASLDRMPVRGNELVIDAVGRAQLDGEALDLSDAAVVTETFSGLETFRQLPGFSAAKSASKDVPLLVRIDGRCPLEALSPALGELSELSKKTFAGPPNVRFEVQGASGTGAIPIGFGGNLPGQSDSAPGHHLVIICDASVDPARTETLWSVNIITSPGAEARSTDDISFAVAQELLSKLVPPEQAVLVVRAPKAGTWQQIVDLLDQGVQLKLDRFRSFDLKK